MRKDFKMIATFQNLCYSVFDTTINKFVLQCNTPLVLSRVCKGFITFIGDTTMDEKIHDAICILPRIEMLCDYLNEEIDQLQELLEPLNADKLVTERICMRIRQLSWISEEISKKVFNDVNSILGGIGNE